MRIGVCGTQCLGKSTFIEDFLKKYPMYSTPENTYRKIIKDKGLSINQGTTPETQAILMDCICDGIINTSKGDNIITDRTPYDALVYSLWAYENDTVGFDKDFIEQQSILAKEASKAYDIIFIFLINKYNQVEIVADNLRDTDPTFRDDIDDIFTLIMGMYEGHEGPFFDWNDCPSVIEMNGDREQRMALTGMYIADDGDLLSDDNSELIKSIGDQVMYDTDGNAMV